MAMAAREIAQRVLKRRDLATEFAEMFHRADRALAQLVRPMTPAEAGGEGGRGNEKHATNGRELFDPANASRVTHDRLTDAAFEATAEGRPLTRDRLRPATDAARPAHGHRTGTLGLAPSPAAVRARTAIRGIQTFTRGALRVLQVPARGGSEVWLPPPRAGVSVPGCPNGAPLPRLDPEWARVHDAAADLPNASGRAQGGRQAPRPGEQPDGARVRGVPGNHAIQAAARPLDEGRRGGRRVGREATRRHRHREEPARIDMQEWLPFAPPSAWRAGGVGVELEAQGVSDPMNTAAPAVRPGAKPGRHRRRYRTQGHVGRSKG